MERFYSHRFRVSQPASSFSQDSSTGPPVASSFKNTLRSTGVASSSKNSTTGLFGDSIITFPLVNRIQETLADSLTCQEPVEPCKLSLKEGYFCNHCNRYLCFKTHQRLYFNKESNSWLKHSPLHPDFKDSESSEDYSDLDAFENNSH